MNGRCETDPFDRAVDVCRVCFGEFCWSCIIAEKGKKAPMCRECALVLSGVRPKAKPKIRGSKKTMKARREALREVRESEPPSTSGLELFSADDDWYEARPEDEESPATEQTEIESGAGPEPQTPAPQAPASQPPAPQVPEPQPAASQIEDFPPTVFSEPVTTSKPPGPQPTPRFAPAPERRTEAPVPDYAPAALERSVEEPTPVPTQASPVSASPMTGSNSDSEPQSVGGRGVRRMTTPPFPTGPPLNEESAEFRKPRPFVDEERRAAARREPEPKPEPAEAGPAVPTPDPEEPVHIEDDPWSRTGPEVVSTAPLPKRRTDPKPIEDDSEAPPDWTKAKLPKRR